VRDDRDLRAVARLARDVGDLDQAVGDLGHLELEQLLDQLGIAAADDDARPAGRGRDLLDDRLDALRVVVALGVGLLLVRGQQRVLEGGDELLLGDALLACERPNGVDDLL
jgi:hypothetical protein